VVKNTRSIEILPEIKTFIFDKTGTLTEGKVKVDEIITMKDSIKEDVIKYFLIAEKHSSHTLAKVLYTQLKEGKRVPEPDHFKEYFGMGVYAKYKGQRIHVGNKKLLQRFNMGTKDLPENLENTIIVSVDWKPIGLITYQDTLKESSKELVKLLKSKRSEIIMLTGDKKKAAEKVGEELGIEKIYSEITPENKLEIVKELRQEKGRLAMIGDGINDAASLAQADVGISVNNEIDLIKESADIVLVGNEIKLIEDLIRKSDFTRTKINQNIFWTYAYNLGAVVIASGLLIPIGLSIDPLIACAASISSTISIMINSFLFR
jgi:Cu+-exporting ATPase